MESYNDGDIITMAEKMDEDYKEKFRNKWKELTERLNESDNKISISDAYHLVKMCVKCDMNFDDFFIF